LRRLISWGPPLVYMAVIFALSAQSNPLPAVTERVWDKLLHVIEYAGLAALVVRALVRERVAWRRALVVAALVASAYGASDEYHQAFVPGRDATPRDWAADTVGGLIGAAAYAFGVERRTAANDERQR
jgi:VanZ family protein